MPDYNDLKRVLRAEGFEFSNLSTMDTDPSYFSITLRREDVQISTWAYEDKTGFKYHLYAKFGSSSGLSTGNVNNEEDLYNLIEAVKSSVQAVRNYNLEKEYISFWEYTYYFSYGDM